MKWDYPTPDRLNAALAFRLTPYKHIAKPVILVDPCSFHFKPIQSRTPMNITIRPLGRGRFAASLGQRLLCESKTPFFTSARILQAEGISDDTPITMTHEGTFMVATRSTLGEAASRIVHETDKDGPKLKRYRPMSNQVPRQRVRHEARTPETKREAPRVSRVPIQISFFQPHLFGDHAFI